MVSLIQTKVLNVRFCIPPFIILYLEFGKFWGCEDNNLEEKGGLERVAEGGCGGVGNVWDGGVGGWGLTGWKEGRERG